MTDRRVGGSLAQPIPNVTATDVERIARRDFPADKLNEVMTLLDSFGGALSARVRAAALKLSKGDVERLQRVVESAGRDYRDVLAAAEYPGYMKVINFANIAEDDERRVIESDWRQYDEWFRTSH